VNNLFFFNLFCTSVCAKKRGMGVDVKKGKNLAIKMKRKDLRSEELSLERGLFLPHLKNETKQERANRILAMMEESNDRLNRLLEIFNRMDR
jgi:hypothetical protein